MSPSDLVRALTALVPTRKPVLVTGPPGVGKSSIVRQVARALDYDLIDLRAVLLDPCDVRGLPTVRDGRVEWCPPGFLPLTGKVSRPGIIFLDELPQAAPLVQSSLLQGVLDYRIGEASIDPAWTWVAAGNRQEDRAGANRLISPLLNRLLHLDLEVSAEDWQEWAAAAGIAPEVRAFLRFKPKLLFDFDPTTNPRAFPTPRSWSFVSDVLPHTPRHLVHPVVAGCVGEGPAAEFYGFLELYQQLPDIDAVLASPTTSGIPKEPSVLYALLGALVEKVRADRSKAGAYAKYATRLPDEYGMLGLRDLLAATSRKGPNGRPALDPAVAANPVISGWVQGAMKKGLFVDVA